MPEDTQVPGGCFKVNMNFAKFIKKSIEAKHLSVRSVAKQIGVDASFFSKVLSGKRSPPSDEKILRKLAKVISVDPVYLIFLAGRIPSEFQDLFLSEHFISLLYKTMKSTQMSAKKDDTSYGFSSEATNPSGEQTPAPSYQLKIKNDITEDLL